MKKFENKIALVTGGTSGIGRATAIAFAREGAKVVISGRREKEGQETIDLLQKEGGEGHFIQSDITEEKQVESLIHETIQKYGDLHVAFNNAGVEGEIGPFSEATTENYDVIMNANLKGVFYSMKHQLRHMLKNGKGSIVNNASIAGLIGFPGASLYVASKHAVLGLTKSVALEVASSGVRINAVSPGAIQTDMVERFTDRNEEGKAGLASMHPMQRIGNSEEIASAVLYLNSDEASFITGQSLAVDGGFTAQ